MCGTDVASSPLMLILLLALSHVRCRNALTRDSTRVRIGSVSADVPFCPIVVDGAVEVACDASPPREM